MCGWATGLLEKANNQYLDATGRSLTDQLALSVNVLGHTLIKFL